MKSSATIKKKSGKIKKKSGKIQALMKALIEVAPTISKLFQLPIVDSTRRRTLELQLKQLMEETIKINVTQRKFTKDKLNAKLAELKKKSDAILREANAIINAAKSTATGESKAELDHAEQAVADAKQKFGEVFGQDPESKLAPVPKLEPALVSEPASEPAPVSEPVSELVSESKPELPVSEQFSISPNSKDNNKEEDKVEISQELDTEQNAAPKSEAISTQGDLSSLLSTQNTQQTESLPTQEKFSPTTQVIDQTKQEPKKRINPADRIHYALKNSYQEGQTHGLLSTNKSLEGYKENQEYEALQMIKKTLDGFNNYNVSFWHSKNLTANRLKQLAKTTDIDFYSLRLILEIERKAIVMNKADRSFTHNATQVVSLIDKSLDLYGPDKIFKANDRARHEKHIHTHDDSPFVNYAIELLQYVDERERSLSYKMFSTNENRIRLAGELAHALLRLTQNSEDQVIKSTISDLTQSLSADIGEQHSGLSAVLAKIKGSAAMPEGKTLDYNSH